MKYSGWKVLVLSVLVMSVIFVQNAGAETVTGIIDSIEVRPNKIVVSGIEINGVRFNYLCNQYNICLEVDDVVSVVYYEYECSDGTIFLKACQVTVDDVTVFLRGCL